MVFSLQLFLAFVVDALANLLRFELTPGQADDSVMDSEQGDRRRKRAYDQDTYKERPIDELLF
ncbi:hypothetical protein ACYCS5_16345 [Paenibacillus sp. SEL3]|uniref:hypothetical protein n=1 Tax=Paenibacillus polymyxa TaxID=1406 RepID=UPI00298CC7CB|nr:hypothetical protein [Paenibacillus polymyxa]